VASVIVKNPAVLSGEPVFRGTRVPFKALTDELGSVRIWSISPRTRKLHPLLFCDPQA
jgi:hypothetical protein